MRGYQCYPVGILIVGCSTSFDRTTLALVGIVYQDVQSAWGTMGEVILNGAFITDVKFKNFRRSTPRLDETQQRLPPGNGPYIQDDMRPGIRQRD
ncbi:hypothetical protein D9M69_685080 [compost metagenome]